jgi:hypothetical protein
LCEEQGLVKTSDGWVLATPYDARNFVNLDWDESLNVSAYTDARWNKVKKRLAHYCADLSIPEIANLKRRYQERPPSDASRSKLYLGQLLSEGLVPDPKSQSLEAICPDVTPRPAPQAP